MASRSEPSSAPSSVSFRRQSSGVPAAASRPEKSTKSEVERDWAARRANQADATITMLSKQVADLTEQFRQLVSTLGEEEKRQALANQLEDSNNQTRQLFGESSSASNPNKTKESMFQLAGSIDCDKSCSQCGGSHNGQSTQPKIKVVEATLSTVGGSLKFLLDRTEQHVEGIKPNSSAFSRATLPADRYK